jgi:hypothetical protein
LIAYVKYKGERIEVTVESYFQGGSGLMANVKAVSGFPFLSSDVGAQGQASGAYNCNGYRLSAAFVYIDDEPTPGPAQRKAEADRIAEEYEAKFMRPEPVQLTHKPNEMSAEDETWTIGGKPVFGSPEWFDDIDEIPF